MRKFRKIPRFILNPRLLLCVVIAWMITNGWSYILLALGNYFGIRWIIAVSSAYLAFLWLPISPEKIATFAIAIALLRWLFPDDKSTLAILKEFYQKCRIAFGNRLQKARGNQNKPNATLYNTKRKQNSNKCVI